MSRAPLFGLVLALLLPLAGGLGSGVIAAQETGAVRAKSRAKSGSARNVAKSGAAKGGSAKGGSAKRGSTRSGAGKSDPGKSAAAQSGSASHSAAAQSGSARGPAKTSEPASAATTAATGGPAEVKAPRASADAALLSDDAQERVRKEGDTEVKMVEFGGLDIEGQLKTPQMLYFLSRLRAEFNRPELPHRSFMPELQRGTREQAF